MEFSGACYHVFSKSNNKDLLFNSDSDYIKFLEYLKKGVERYRILLYAYCLMGTHYHLHIATTEANLSRFMHFLGSSYASYLATNGWEGHIFAGRYKAICIDEEEYFLTVNRYIHLNPVVALLVDKPGDYTWSSYPLYLDEDRFPYWMNKDWVSEYFGPGFEESIGRYRDFVESNMDSQVGYPEDKVVAGAMLGDDAFVNKVMEKIGNRVKKSDVAHKKPLLRRFTIDNIYEEVCVFFGLSDLSRTGKMFHRELRQARKYFIYLAREYADSTNAEIAQWIGDIGPPCVSAHYIQFIGALNGSERVSEKAKEQLSEILIRLQTPFHSSPVL